MPNLLQKKTPSVHKRLMNSLKALNCTEEVTYLIDALKETKINSYAQAAIFIFTLAYSHPRIMSDSQHETLQKLCQDCYLNATPNQLFIILNKPENLPIKTLFDRFVDYTLKENEKTLQKRRPSTP